VVIPEVGGLGTGVRLTEDPLMSMEAEVRDDRGVSIVEGIAETGDCDDPLPDTCSITVMAFWCHNIKIQRAESTNTHLPDTVEPSP